MTHELNLEESKNEWHGTVKAYVIGFFGSLILTAISFLLVITKPFSKFQVMIAIVFLALIQAIVQLRYFLHVGEEPKPRWETVIFYLMVVILIIIAIGSLWIMYDLNDRLMTGMEMSHD
jgi:cytochrome o ubiquinol oxidase operon protein cyoD